MVIARSVIAVSSAAAAAAAAILALSYSRRDHGGIAAESPAWAATPQECAVCLSELAAAAVRTLPRCGHAFHAECVGRWMALRAGCPLCRCPVVEGNEPATRAAVVEAAWARPPRMVCGFGGGRVVWTRSPSESA